VSKLGGQVSCHTAQVDGYVIEGHVPADDMKPRWPSGPTRLAWRCPACPSVRPAWARKAHARLTTSFSSQGTARPASSPGTKRQRA